MNAPVHTPMPDATTDPVTDATADPVTDPVTNPTADQARLRLAIILGSTRRDRFCPAPGRWIAERAAAREDFTVDTVDLAEARLPETLAGDDPDVPLPEPVRALAPRLAAADAFVVVTPVYNRGYPAALKNAIDWYYEEWSAKPVGYVSYGGMAGGVYAVEQLRPVFNEVHAISIRNTISFANFWEQFDDDRALKDPAALEGPAASFLDQLAWWGRALKEARTARPYRP